MRYAGQDYRALHAMSVMDRNAEFACATFMENARHLVTLAKQTPYFHLKGYMNRWWLEREGELNAEGAPTGPAKRIHEILRSDADRHLHDHPWDYTTVILAGGYWEERPADPLHPTVERVIEWMAPGRILRRQAESAHRLILPDGATCTTLFATGPRRRDWGFHTEAGWVHWRQYLNIPEGTGSAGQPATQTGIAKAME